MENRQRISLRSIRFTQILIILSFCSIYCTQETEAFNWLPQAKLFLEKYYILDRIPKIAGDLTEKVVRKGIVAFQKFIGLEVTGEMNAETARLMQMPRCGVEDLMRPEEGRKLMKYQIQGSKWPNKILTYKITKYASTLDRQAVDKEIARAFAVWSEYTDLTFSPTKYEADIEIKFVSGDHQCMKGSFEGTSDQVYAHALFPQFGGAIHFNDDKEWTINSNHGQNLYQNAVHQIGHSLGLGHSNVKASVMFPEETSYDPNFELGEGDVEGIQEIYGPKIKARVGFESAEEAVKAAVSGSNVHGVYGVVIFCSLVLLNFNYYIIFA